MSFNEYLKKYFIILFLLFCSNLVAQTLDDLKKLDSIYFYFSVNESQKKNIFYVNNVTKDTVLNYSYHKNDKEYLKFRYSKFKDFDAYFGKLKTYKKYHKKRFLKKNKDQIVDINFLNELSLNTFEFRAILQGKKLFLIDKEDTRRRKILIREVFINMFDAPTCIDEDLKIFKTRNIIPFYFEMQINDNFYSFLKPKKTDGDKDIYILFESSDFAVKENTYNYFIQYGNTYSAPRIEEQYTFKLNIKKQVVFLQLTHKRKKSQKIEKKYDLFAKAYKTVLFEDLNSFSEKQLEDLFSKINNIYVVEDFSNKEYVLPKLVKITSEVNDFVEQNKE